MPFVVIRTIPKENTRRTIIQYEHHFAVAQGGGKGAHKRYPYGVLVVVHRPSIQCLFCFFIVLLLLRDERTGVLGGVHLKQALPAAGFLPSRRVCSKRGLFLGMPLPPAASDVGGYFLLPCGRLKKIMGRRKGSPLACWNSLLVRESH